jgi:hypothetical protein
MESLDCKNRSSSIVLPPDVLMDLNDVVGAQVNNVAVERCMVQGAERQAVPHLRSRGRAPPLSAWTLVTDIGFSVRLRSRCGGAHRRHIARPCPLRNTSEYSPGDRLQYSGPQWHLGEPFVEVRVVEKCVATPLSNKG